MKKKNLKWRAADLFLIVLSACLYWSVIYFIIINACKDRAEASRLSMALPSEWKFWDNLLYVLNYNGHIFIRSFFNSVILTVSVMVILVLVASMAAFILSRRGGAVTAISDKLILAGLTTPLSVIPTYWMLSRLHLSGTLGGLVLVEVALLFPFSTMLYKGYMSSIPGDIDEAAIVDGCNSWQLFLKIEFPLLKPITAAVIILRAVVVYNDFANPMYFLAGAKSSTVQLCIYTFQSAFSTDWGHLFAAIVVVCFPPVVLFLVLNKKIMEGVTMGAVKG